MAAYFSNVQRKEISNERKDKFDKHEINGDEEISLSGKAEIRQPTSGRMLLPKRLGATAGAPTNHNLDEAAEWITHDPQFARNLANRAWYHLFGRGVVEPPDDFRDSNPPTNPELLDALRSAFADSGLHLKSLVRLILTSKTFQRSSRGADDGPMAEANFALAAVRPMPAEVLLDAASQVLEQPEAFKSAPAGSRAVQLADNAGDNSFLRVFGKPERLLTCECERNSSTTLGQALQMINGDAIRRKLDAKNNRIGRLLAAGKSNREIVEEFTLAALCRMPSDAEMRGAEAYLASAKDRRKAVEDLVWAILNSKEFLLIR
jgi:hypothetical protein